MPTDNAGLVNDKQVDDEEELGYAYGARAQDGEFRGHSPSVQSRQWRLAWHLPHPLRHGTQDSGHRELHPDAGGMKARRHDGKRGVLRSLLERVQCRDAAWRDITHVARDKDETMLLCCRGE